MSQLLQAYHQRSKHRLERYAAGPDTLDWDAQPDPFRRYVGAPLTGLPLDTSAPMVAWDGLGVPGRATAQPLDLRSLGLLFQFSLALAAWKTQGPDRWAVRINPSSGNLHPTEGWLVCRGVSGLSDGVHHYAPHEHALEQRALFAPDNTPARAFVALSSIAWREAWKYGERAFRYCQLDAGHATGALRYAAALLGWRLRPVACDTAALAHLLGLDRDADFGAAEREEPDGLFELLPTATTDHAAETAADNAPWSWTAQASWQGQANRLDRHPMYRWPVIDEVIRATQRQRAAVPPAEVRDTRPSTPGHSADTATLIRQRRSAQRFDARARAPLESLWPLLQALTPTACRSTPRPARPACTCCCSPTALTASCPAPSCCLAAPRVWTCCASNFPRRWTCCRCPARRATRRCCTWPTTPRSPARCARSTATRPWARTRCSRSPCWPSSSR